MPHDHQATVAGPSGTEIIADTAVRAAAARLATAVATGTPCVPVRDLIGNIASAYRVQEHLIAARVAAGRHRVGRKIGLTSPAVQAQLGVDQPDFGVLLDDMRVELDESIDADRLLQPKIEAELAFVLGHDLDQTDLSLEAVNAAIVGMAPALEIVDSRIRNWDITITDTIADNASSGLFVLGPTMWAPDAVDPAAITMTLTEDGALVSSGDGAACLGSPLLALQWLARTAATYGDPLRAGDIVLSGALGPMVTVRPGSRYEAELSGLGGVHAVFDRRPTFASKAMGLQG